MTRHGTPKVRALLEREPGRSFTYREIVERLWPGNDHPGAWRAARTLAKDAGAEIGPEACRLVKGKK